MTAEKLLARIEAIADDKNREFFSRLSHTRYKLYGARVPDVRKLAKELAKEDAADDVIALPPMCYEHVMLKGILIAGATAPLGQKVKMLDGYAALIDDWALCDVACSCLKFKTREEFDAMKAFAASQEPFKARLGLIAIESCFCKEEYAEEIGDAGAGALKKYVTESVNEFLAPHRERRAELAKDMDAIRDILHDGNKRANAIAEETLDEVRAAMGMKY